MITTTESILRRLRGSHLALLIALDDNGSLRKAADQVALSQPGATKALHEIERMIGETLFVRSPRGIVPNEFGRCVIRHARNLRGNMGALREELVALTRGSAGTLSVGAIMEAIPVWVVPVLAAMRGVQPDVTVEVWEEVSARLLTMLDERKLDLALTRVMGNAHPDVYDFSPLPVEGMCFIVDSAHPLADAPDVQFRDIAGDFWVVAQAHLSNRLLLEQIFEDEDLAFPTHAIEASSTFAMLSLLRTGERTVALVPLAVARHFAEYGVIRILPIVIQQQRQPYGIVTRRGAILSRTAQTFVDICMQRLSERDDETVNPASVPSTYVA
jgi:DNA-binding transcriptional LysR family regulator